MNTGWTGGGYGIGRRIRLAYPRALIDAIHSGKLSDAETQREPVFGFDTVVACTHVPSELMRPREAWLNAAAYDGVAKKLAGLFVKNFKQYDAGVSAEVRSASPAV